jgi:putative hemolysin
MVLWEVITVFLLILLNGFFAMAELAVISSRRARLQAMAEEGSRGARAALALTDDSGRFLSSVQIGITLIGILAGAFGGATLAVRLAEVFALWSWLEPYASELALGLVVAVITYLSLIIGELVPKQLALHNAERIASWVSVPMGWIARVASPAVHLLDVSTRLCLRILGERKSSESAVTEEEIKMLITEATDAGVVEHAERAMISEVMRLGDLRVQALMTPRPDIVWIDLEDDRDANLRKLRDSHHSRFPVARGELDELVGILQAKDLLDASLDGRPVDLTVVREAVIVPEGSDALQLLELLKLTPMHLALVVDEYGSVQGLVTATDLMEAIVGGLAEGAGEEPEVTVREDGSWLMDGSVSNARLKEILRLKSLPEEEDYHTLAGFMLAQLAHVPAPGEHVRWASFRFEVMDMDGHRIDKVLVSRIDGDNSLPS